MVYLKNVVTLELDEAACTGCGRCAEVCPHAVFVLESGRSKLRQRDACMECGACALNCPAGAIQVQAGVGCASGILNVMLGRKAACCCEARQGGGMDDASRAGSQATGETRAGGGECRHE
jgi:NAD-dependent dihydropyrimidine dehydrogenase PreA subunit